MIPKITPINSSNRLTTAHRHLAMAWNKSFVVAVVMLFSSRSAGAVDVNSAPFQILSEGATTCGEFVAEPSMQSARMAWVLGYISGRNREAVSPDNRTIGSSFQRPATVIAWLQHYCQLHSLDMLVYAADKLRADFQRHESR